MEVAESIQANRPCRADYRVEYAVLSQLLSALFLVICLAYPFLIRVVQSDAVKLGLKCAAAVGIPAMAFMAQKAFYIARKNGHYARLRHEEAHSKEGG
jgi:hypothetical protein